MKRNLIRICFISLLVAGLMSCGKKKKTVSAGGDPEKISDFIALFPSLSLPWQVHDSTLMKKDRDSSVIKEVIFAKFVPDSIVKRLYAKNAKMKIFPLGRVDAGSETYLFAKTSALNKPGLLVLAYNKKQEFISSASFSKPSANLTQALQMDRRFTLTRTILRRNNDGSFSEGKEVYVLNAEAKQFTLIMTESLDDKMTELINPIDTLQRSHKYAADYSNARMSLVSIRDGRKSDRVSFFIHFEKNNGDCTGELKGEAVFRTPTMAEYQLEGDPCVLQFIFSKSAVTLKEIDGCGSRRGLQCSFDGNYPRKREAKPKK